MKVEEIRALGSPELSKQLEEAQHELFNLRFRHATKQLVNYRELNNVRKKIARIKTIQRERELADSPEKLLFAGGSQFAGE
ncbi:50S ribosomal protein L29 [Chloroflexota bacterium]